MSFSPQLVFKPHNLASSPLYILNPSFSPHYHESSLSFIYDIEEIKASNYVKPAFQQPFNFS